MKWTFLAVVVVVGGCERSVEPAETVSVVFPRRSIPKGVTITNPEQFFQAVQYFKGEEPKEGITDLERLKGRVVNHDLAKNRPVKESDLSPWAVPEGIVARQDIPKGITIDKPEKLFRIVSSGNGEEYKVRIAGVEILKGKVVKRALAKDQQVDYVSDLSRLAVPEGLQAVTIKQEFMGGGLILPGCRVDVVSLGQSENDEEISKILMEDLLVLAIDWEGSSATLAVPPKQAEKLTQAAANEYLWLALRPITEN